jgi:Calcineurin-like phosphoesterase
VSGCELIIGDVHARAGALEALLHKVGAIDDRGRREPGWWIVQVGDLLHRRATVEANLATAQLAQECIDIVLAGNHERCMLADGSSPHGAALGVLATRGWPQAAAECGDWLVTHAGVHPELAQALPADAFECAHAINDRWHRRTQRRGADPLFDWVGPARGGDAPYGGILWMHSDEWPAEGATPWGQVVGHVPQAKPRLLEGPRWAIDVGSRNGRLAGLVCEDGSDRWRPVVATVEGDAYALRRAPALAAA